MGFKRGSFKMENEIEFTSNWQSQNVELMKILHGFEEPVLNEEVGSVDYTSFEDDDTKILRVLVEDDGAPSPGYVKKVSRTVDDVNETEVDEALILANRFTPSARRMLKQRDDVDYLSPKVVCPYSVSELVYAIQQKTMELCKLRCGQVPKSREDCDGIRDREYICPVRRISDDADFHAEMKWREVLYDDFSLLMDLEDNPEMLEVN